VGVTIKDVAREAGVSTATVSRVINSDNRISPATRQHVLDVVSRLNYKVNSLARSLKSKRSLTIGMVVPELDNIFFMRVARGVEDLLGEQGYSMIVVNTRESRHRESAAVELLLEKQVDGIIIVPSERDGTHLAICTQAGVPAVLVDRLVHGFESDAVLVDNKDATYRAIRDLIAQGYHSYGFIGGERSIFTAEERYQGFLQALQDADIAPEDRNIRFGDYHMESGFRLMRQLMEQSQPPKTVMVANYFMHLGVVRYVSKNRASIPPDLFIASFDNMEFSSASGVAGLSIAQPIDEIGRRAAEILMQRMRGDTAGWPQITRLPTTVITHDTV
jgi:LacI family transcriptional regulator